MIRWIKRQWYKIPVYVSEQDNVTYGKFRVLYTDGQRSRPSCYRVAKDYVEIFGGKVIDNF